MEEDSEFKAEPSQIEQAKLENALLQAEYKYGKDIKKLQDALIRARKMGVLHLIGIHLKIIFLAEIAKTIPLERALFKWRSKCVVDLTSRNRKMKAVLNSMYHTIITRAFYVFKERRMQREHEEKSVEGPIFAQGALAPLSSDDDDLEI